MPQPTKLIRQQIQNKRGKKERRSNWLRLAFILSAVGVALIVAPILLIGGGLSVSLISSASSLPNYSELETEITAKNQAGFIRFFGRDESGEPIELFSSEKIHPIAGEWVLPEELSDTLLNLVYAQWPELFLDTSDANNPLSLETQSDHTLDPIDSIIEYVRGEPLGSNLFGRLERNFLRDQIETSWESEQIAAWHLNNSYFGNQVFGIESAARFYFDRDATQLTLPEAAMLLGIPQNPIVNPLDDPAGAKLQQELMLEALLRANLISQEQFIAARFTPLNLNLAPFAERDDLILERFLYSRLEGIYSPDEIASNNFNIFTSIDPNLQQQVHCLTDFYLHYIRGQGLVGDGDCPEAVDLASSDYFPTAQFNRTDSILTMVINPKNGQILAISGAGAIVQNPSGLPQHPAGNREAGEIFYPFIYLTALSQGHTLSSMVFDISDGDSDAPSGEGPIFLEEALLSSSSAAANHVLNWTGIGATFKTASEMGATPIVEAGNYRPGETDAQFRFTELAQAYGVLANNGIRVGIQPFGQPQQLIAINQVENERGDILYEIDQGKRIERAILPDELTWLINQQLANETLPNGQAIARVTSGGNRNHNEWTIGYSPDLVVAVWMGNQRRAGEGAGLQTPTQQSTTLALWHTIMSAASENRPLATWATPENIVSLDVCWPSGLQPTGLCPTRQGFFVAGTEPVLFDTMYQEFLINGENGNLATSSTPPNRVKPIIIQVFPPEAQNWATFNGYAPPPSTYDSIRTENTTTGFSVASPTAFAEVRQQFAIQIELAELNRFEYFRIASYQGLSPGALQILAERVEPKRNLLNLDIPLTFPTQESELNTLLITGFQEDGSIEELAIPVNIKIDN